MSEPRTIKKYPNRRLYDTATSSYVTLQDVRRLVVDEVSFVVIDARSKVDITRSILLQIILEQEEDGEPIFSEPMLTHFIRCYGGTWQTAMSTYLEKSLDLFVSQQADVRERMQDMITAGPMSLMRESFEQNVAMWNEIQEGFFKGTNAQNSAQQKKKTGD